MVSASIEQLLILQDRDARCEHIKKQLAQIPLERAQTEREIAGEQARVKEAEAAIAALQRQNRELETAVEDAEERIRRYLNQQLSVKKNEEYQALEHEMALLREQISRFEDDQLVLLDQIDVQTAALAETKSEVAGRISGLEGHLRQLAEAEADNQSQLDDAGAAVEAARKDIEAEALRDYDYVRNQVKRPPYVAALEDGKCGGCHLRVSGGIESEARRGQTLARCDSCGRILYFDR